MGLAYLDLPASEREWWVARHEKKAAEHSCGNPRDVCGDPAKLWYPQRSTCYATREREAAVAKFNALHTEKSGRVWHDGTESSWSKVRDDDHPYKFDMGVKIWVGQKDYSPDDRFLSAPDLLPDDDDQTEAAD